MGLRSTPIGASMNTSWLAITATLAAFTLPAQAELVGGALKFYSTANGFGVRSFAENTTPLQDPYVDLTVKVTKSKGLSSFFRFERALSRDSGTVPYAANLYVVPKGAVLTPDSLANGSYKLISTNATTKSITALVGRDFWLAMATTPAYPAKRSVLSWLHVRFNAAGKPEMLDHISAYDEPGIVVGLKTPCTTCAP
jgi:hypothetical protein